MNYFDPLFLESLGVQVGKDGAVNSQRLLIHSILYHQANYLIDDLVQHRVVRGCRRRYGQPYRGVKSTMHPGHAALGLFPGGAADHVRLAIAGAKGKLCFQLADGCGYIVGRQITDIGIIPGDNSPQAILVDLVLCPLQPLFSQAVIVNPLFIIDG